VLGRFSTAPVLEVTIPSAVDKTIAPEGKHIMSIFVQYAPYKLAEAEWESDSGTSPKDVFFEMCMNALARYAPGIKEQILHKQIITPVDLEKTYGITGGNIFQGSMLPHQMGPFRPVAGWGYETPIQGLYLCGAASHPGGGVMGACGKNAAEVILKNL